jgi:DNA-binding transcriptional MerR regulator
MLPMKSATFTTEDARRRTGATAVQLAYFIRTRVIVPAVDAPRRGMTRMFDFENLVQISIAVRLANWGVSADQIRELLSNDLHESGWPKLFGPDEKRGAVECLWAWRISERTDRGLNVIHEMAKLMPAGSLPSAMRAGQDGLWINMRALMQQLETDPEEDDPGRDGPPINQDDDE